MVLGDGGDDGGGIIFPGHPGPVLSAPRGNISRKGNPSLRYMYIYIYICYIYNIYIERERERDAVA